MHGHEHGCGPDGADFGRDFGRDLGREIRREVERELGRGLGRGRGMRFNLGGSRGFGLNFGPGGFRFDFGDEAGDRGFRGGGGARSTGRCCGRAAGCSCARVRESGAECGDTPADG